MRLSSALFTGAGLAAFVATLPIVSAITAGLIANVSGCELNEGMAHSCIVAGVNIGPALYNMFVAGWLFILSFLYIPVAIALAIAAIVVLQRGRRDPVRNGRVGGGFWLSMAAGLIFPIAQDIALIFMLGAAFFWWRQKRKSDPNSVEANSRRTP